MRTTGMFVMLAAPLFSLCAAGAVLHISPQGDDAAAGTAEAPVQSLARLQVLLSEQADVTEVVFHDGMYHGTLTVSAPAGTDAKALPLLLLRAAEGATPVLNGAVSLPAADAVPVEGMPGVYRWDAAPFRSEARRQRGHIPPVWDAAARVRYALVADRRAVESFSGSYTFTADSLFLHTTDGRPPAGHRIEIGVYEAGGGGLFVQRPNVTVRGLSARNYCANMFSAGFIAGTNAERVTFEDCGASNCSRGFRVRGNHAQVLRCRAEDVGCGVLLNGDHALVEDGVFCRGPRDLFRVVMQDVQEDTGIEVYYPASGDIVIRRNTVRGFSSRAVLFKCRPGEFLVEHNTFVDNTTGVDYMQAPNSSVTMRHNIVLGGQRPMNGRVHQSRIAHRAYGNVVWPAPWRDGGGMRSNLEYMNSVGENNVFADPRLAAPEAGDFRLLADSPCLDRVAAGIHVGALGPVPADFRDVHPPLLDLSNQPALTAIREAIEQSRGSEPLFAASRREFPLRLRALDAAGHVVSMRLRVGDGPWAEPAPYAEDVPLRLPADAGEFAVQVRVADDAGNWSEPSAIRVRAAVATPQLVGDPVVRTGRHGVGIAFQTNVECHAVGEIGLDEAYGTALLAAGTTQAGDKGPARREHVLGLLRPDDAEGRPWHYRVRLSNRDGDAGQEFTGLFRFAGEPRAWFVSPTGQDLEEDGTAEKPWRTLQYAVDRALPGDRVTLRPGLYTEGTRITRGGVEQAPLVIAAEKKWEAVLDGRRRIDNLIRIENTAHIEIVGLEMRWFGDTDGDRAQWAPAIRLFNAPHVTVREGKIWNDFWGGRLSGYAVTATNSPGFVLERSLLYRLDWAMSLSASPGARLLFNTFRGFSHGGLSLNESIAGTVIRNNSFTHYGNYAYWIRVTDPAEMDSFDADYNNLGTRIRHWRDEPGVVPNLPSSWGGSKTVGGYMRRDGTFIGGATRQPRAPWDGPTPDDEGWEGPPCQRFKFLPNAITPEDQRGAPFIFQDTFEDWRIFSGKDKNSIYADPRHHNILEFDFRLEPDSPNIGAGENGANIGAMPVVVGTDATR